MNYVEYYQISRSDYDLPFTKKDIRRISANKFLKDNTIVFKDERNILIVNFADLDEFINDKYINQTMYNYSKCDLVFSGNYYSIIEIKKIIKKINKKLKELK
jgi:hypothetical protein